MKKTKLVVFAAFLGCMGVSQNLSAQTMMEPATLDNPKGLYVSMAPGSVSVTYDNQPLQLVNPMLNDWGEECVTSYVILGEGEEQPVSASLISSFGNPDDPEDKDIWLLDIALYELDDLFSFSGNTVTVIIPEGIVSNETGALNPRQEMIFEIVPTYTDFTMTPDTGSVIDAETMVKIGFGGNPISRLQDEIVAYVYEPSFKVITLTDSEFVSISEDNEIVLNLSGLESGYYEIVVPEGYVMVEADGEMYLSPSIWLEYTVENSGESSGVIMTASSSQTVTASTLQGYTLLKNAAPETLRQLPAGIYVVNGRKVLIRK